MDESQISAARRLRSAEFAADARQARIEHDSDAKAIDERTARLRNARLARSAAKQTKRPRPGMPRREAEEAAKAVEPQRLQPGDQVRIVARAFGNRVAGGVYTIVSQLPADQNGNVYRVRSETEKHDRVVGEAQLARVGG